jgi:membrane-bound serine protease (ClpP class)
MNAPSKPFARILLLTWTALLAFALIAGIPARAQTDAPLVLVLTADGPLTQTMSEYLNRGIEAAQEQGAELLILQLNTPGGEIGLMNSMVQDIRASTVPIVVYVAPRGAMAASAGTMLTLAGHAAAMAPETAIGAASPVGGEGEDLGETMEAKEKNILKATVRSLAEDRGEAAVALAEATIESAEAVSANEALEIGLIDFIADDQHDLMIQLDGFTVETVEGEITLETTNAQLVPFELSFIEEILGVMTNPNIVFLLLTIGVQAILIELSSPGGWVAGFIGVVSLALAVYGLGILPVNWFGLIFLLIAFVLFLLEVKAPTHGALTVAGMISLVVGALVLFNSSKTPDFLHVSVPLVIGTAIATAGFFFAVVTFAMRARMLPVRTGQEALIGRVGLARSEIPRMGIGTVQMGGELWTAELEPGEEVIPKGAQVEIVRTQGVRVIVRQTGE